MYGVWKQLSNVRLRNHFICFYCFFLSKWSFIPIECMYLEMMESYELLDTKPLPVTGYLIYFDEYYSEFKGFWSGKYSWKCFMSQCIKPFKDQFYVYTNNIKHHCALKIWAPSGIRPSACKELTSKWNICFLPFVGNLRFRILAALQKVNLIWLSDGNNTFINQMTPFKMADEI